MIEKLLELVARTPGSRLTVEHIDLGDGDAFHVAKLEVASLQVYEWSDASVADAVYRLHRHLFDDAWLDADPMEPDWDRLARDAEGEHPRHDAEEPEVQ